MDRNTFVIGCCIIYKGQARKSLWIETIHSFHSVKLSFGQARKSLWIETMEPRICEGDVVGQARKSLWIETSLTCSITGK